ncbi:MAG: GNAT family N-acetyltransferase [bacterium]
MVTITTRPLHEEEFHAAVGVACAAFGEQATREDEEAYRQVFELERSLCAFEADTMVGMSAVLTLELTLPGGVAAPAGGLTWAAVLPTHRRRGVLRQLMAAQLADMTRRGELVSALLASEGNIYGRFGYGPATSALSFSVERARAAFARPVCARGRIVLLTGQEAAAELPTVYERLQRVQPGAVSRPPGWWKQYLHDPEAEREGGGEMLHAKHVTASGEPDGYVTYRIKQEWQGMASRSTLLVVELLAADPEVYAALWDFVLNTDLIHTISFSRGAVDEPLRWLLADPRAFAVRALTDYLWVRLLDIPGALAARAYSAADEMVLEVNETFPAPITTRVALRVGRARSQDVECAPTTEPADLALELSSLGATYLGGVSFATLAAAGRVRELRAGSVERADAMFSTGAAPYCVTMF